MAGYACHGPTPGAAGVHDLYWIAVDPSLQGRGVGGVLLRAVAARIQAEGGRQMVIETASKPSYAATRAFYLRHGAELVDRVPDYYAPGDDKLVLSIRCQAPN